MGNNMAAMLRLHWLDTRFSFTVFWLALLGCELVFFVLAWLFSGGVMFTGWFAVYIFAFVSGVTTINSTFPVALGWSVPRKDFYLATVVHYVTVALALAAVYMVLYFVEQTVLSTFVGDRLHVFTAPFITEPTFWLLAWMHFIFALTMMSIGHFFGSLHYRYGQLGVVTFIVIMVLLVSLMNLFGTWGWLIWLAELIDSFEKFTLWLVPFNIAVWAVAWLFLRKAPARKMG